MNRDFRDLLAVLHAHDVEYLVVGAHALAAHGHVRATKDLDVWVRPDPANAGKTLRALQAFGAPLQDLTANDLSQPGLIFQIGVPPVRIDVVTAIDGVSFEEAWSSRMTVRFGDQPVFVLSRKHLIFLQACWYGKWRNSSVAVTKSSRQDHDTRMLFSRLGR